MFLVYVTDLGFMVKSKKTMGRCMRWLNGRLKLEPWDILRRYHAGLEREDKETRIWRQRGTQDMQHISKPMTSPCPFSYFITKSLGQITSGKK